MADGRQHGDAAAEAVPNEVGRGNLEIVEQCRDIVGQIFVAEIALDVGDSSMPLHLHGDDLPGFRELGNHLRPVGRDGHERAVQQDDGLALAVDFVVHPEAVHRGVAGLGLLCRHDGADRNLRSTPFVRI